MNKEYRFFLITPYKTYKSSRLDLYDVFILFLNHLNLNRVLDEYNKGTFVTTYNVFKHESLIKRYFVEINIPYSKFEIRKISKGSLNPDDFLKSLEFIKEKYYDERI